MKILAISPHPDDVEYSISGILLKAKRNIEPICITIAYNKKYDIIGDEPSIDYETRTAEAKLACKILGAEYKEFSIDDKIENMANFILRISPDIIFLPYYNDYNEIHKKTTEYMMYAIEAAKKLKKDQEIIVKQLIYYEAYSSINFIPEYVINVSDTFSNAKRILLCHKMGIKTLEVLPYKFQILHQLRGLDCAMPYGEGIIRESSGQYNWNVNLRIFSEFLYKLTCC